MDRVAVDFGVGQGVSAVPISSEISAERSTQANAKSNATVDGARQKGSWRRRSVVTARCGDAPPSLLAICPSASTRDPSQFFNSLLGDGLLELRHVGKLNTRILWFFVKGRRIIAVHGIRNKGQSIPARDLQIARDRMRDWQERS